MQTPIETFTNEGTGVEVNIYANSTRAGYFNIVLTDTDADMTLDVVKIVPSLERARQYALSCVL